MSDLALNISPIEQSLSLKDKIYDSLKSAITSMNIYDSDAELRLDERNLSEQFGISRTPLREALVRLEQEGLVRVVPRRGIFIVRKSKTEILEMITVWAALESMAARLITLNGTDAEIGELRRMLPSFADNEVREHMDEYSDANIAFHQTILRLSHCKLLETTANGLFMHVRAIRARTIFEKDRADKSVIDHLNIVEAIEARDTERAEHLVREHTLKLKAHVEKHVDLD